MTFVLKFLLGVVFLVFLYRFVEALVIKILELVLQFLGVVDGRGLTGIGQMGSYEHYHFRLILVVNPVLEQFAQDRNLGEERHALDGTGLVGANQAADNQCFAVQHPHVGVGSTAGNLVVL